MSEAEQQSVTVASNHRKSRAAALSVASNTTLVVMKLMAGIFSGSVSIISEAIHSANDLLASLIAYWSIRIADRPPDQEHPFGHGKAESISGAIEAGLILIAAIWIVVEAVRKILSGGEIEHLGLGTLIMGFSAVVNFAVSRYLFKVAKAEDSLALEADAQHLSTDVFTSLGVAVGLLLVWWTGWRLLDPLMAILVALFIGRIGWKLTLDAGRHLMDYRLPESEVEQIKGILDSEVRIESWHDLRTRKSGSYRQIDLHIVLPENASLMEAHEIADDLERRIATELQSAHVVIHTDPYDDSLVSPQP